MTGRFPHDAAWLALVGCCTALASSCGQFRSPAPPNSAAGRHAPAPAQLAQVGFGRDASFAQCVPPDCPTRTPKTLAHETPRQAIDPTTARALAEPVTAHPTVPAAPAEPLRTVTVQLALGSAKLNPTARSQLHAAMGDLPRVRGITIIGRTDSTVCRHGSAQPAKPERWRPT